MADNRSQTFKVQFPAGTAAGTHQLSDVLDSTYTKATGVVTYTNQDGGVPFFQLGILDSTKTYCSLANSKFYEAGIDCPKPLRNTPVSIACNNSRLMVQVELPQALTEVLDVDVVFTLEK